MAGSGVFITFEGGEGTGKSTQIQALADRLTGEGRDVVVTREPGGTAGAEQVRALLVTGDTQRWSPAAEALLNYAARDDHLRRIIRPALAAGKVVLCDRFLDSTRAYQGIAAGGSAELIGALEAAIVGDTMPDVTLVLDLDPVIGLKRVGERATDGEDRYERKGPAFHTQLREAFRSIAAAAPLRCRLVDASGSADEIAETVWQAVAGKLQA